MDESRGEKGKGKEGSRVEEIGADGKKGREGSRGDETEAECRGGDWEGGE